ncbi:MAG TPA: hypothetical protein VE620_02295 [Myxococcales bacterium]|nr:hypothetical protein [Myxococcales bacterium]
MDLPAAPRSRAALWLTLGIVALHAGPLAASLRDYRVSVDSGYHVSLARWYAEHHAAWWDGINYQPRGRPNLQGPALHVGIAVVGRALGGSGDAYVLANAILAFLQWLCAVFTVWYFARREGGDEAGLFAVALFTGSAFVAGSFYVGLPSGWIFILVPWAIDAFLKDRAVVAGVLVALGIYTHLGGYLTAPVGILIAALLVRRRKQLLVTGGVAFVLALPYTVHFLRYRDWYRGEHGHVATELAPLLLVLGAAALVRLAREPRRNAFLLAWTLAPVAWLFQDYTRFLMQAMLAASVIGAVLLTDVFYALNARFRRIGTAAVLALATLWPFTIPSLAAEWTWALGARYPRPLDWSEARALAGVLKQNHLENLLVDAWDHSFAPSLAVFADVRLQRGHWVEVQKPDDPARDLPTQQKVFVAPVPADDPVLKEMERRGWLRDWGGTAKSAVITVGDTVPPLGEAAQVIAPLASENASWLAANARNNRLEPRLLLSRGALAEHRARMLEQRTRAGRVALLALVYAHALEPAQPQMARGSRDAFTNWGVLAGFLGDEDTLDFIDERRHETLRRNLSAWSQQVLDLRAQPLPSQRLNELSDKLFRDYFWAA